MFARFTTRIGHAALLAALCAALAGCATWQGPRIDPSGNQLIIWPNQTPSPIYAVPGGAVVAPPPAGLTAPPTFVTPPPASIAPPPGNFQAAPVFPDVPAAPLAPTPSRSWNPFAPAPVVIPALPAAAAPPGAVPLTSAVPVTAAVPVSPAGVATPLGTAIPVGRDYLRVTPDRIMAPVGSEVVLKAGICSASGYLLANQRVEWLLSSGGAGQFVDLAERDQVSVTRWLWDTPRKIDNAYAITSTSWVPVCLDRGTPDPGDDVQILKGDAWVTVTSAIEGTSHVTAYTPAVDDWNLRRATATIYWVDAQWILPPSAVAEVGRPHVLTTTVTRRTDGAPLAGWLVRYDVPSGASLGYQGGNVVEVPTDGNGRASVEVAPSGLGGGSATVGITIVRPPQGGADASPRLEVGRGAATITWAGGVGAPTTTVPFTSAPAPTLPTAPLPGASSTTPFEPTAQPTLPSTTAPAEPYKPPRDEPPPGRARLEVRIDPAVPEQVAVGDFVSFNVTVTNTGDGTARGVLIKDEFDRGLKHPEDRSNRFVIEYPEMRDLPPRESETVPLTFQVTTGGTQCHRVTVSAEGADPVTARGCVTARQSALEVTVTGPRLHIVGERATFRAVVKNVGDVAATNVVIVARCDPALNPVEAERGHVRLPDGGIQLEFERMDATEQRTFTLTADCLSEATSACTRFLVTADGGVTAAHEACVEILSVRSQPGTTGVAAPNLRITITENANPARSGQRQILMFTVTNASQQVARDVALSVLLPQQLTPDATQIQPAGEATILGQEIRFKGIPELQPQDERRYVIPVTVGQTGEVQVRAAVTATGLIDIIRAESNVIKIIPQ